MPSFYIPLSGLDADSTALNTIANNLSNMNTTGFKAQTTNFSDLFYQEMGTTGSGDQIQVGTGVQVASNSTDFTGGSISSTGISTDAAINGTGFFVLDNNGSQLYTRDGNFQTSATGTLETSGGQAVMGYAAVNGVVNTGGGLSDIAVPTGQVMQPSATTSFSMTQNLDSSSPIGTQTSGQVQICDSLGKTYEATVTYTNLGNNTWSYSISVPDKLAAAPATPATAVTGMAVTPPTPAPTSVAVATTVAEPLTTVPSPLTAAAPTTTATTPVLNPAAAVPATVTNSTLAPQPGSPAGTYIYNFPSSNGALATVDPNSTLQLTGLNGAAATVSTAPVVFTYGGGSAPETVGDYVTDLNTALTASGIVGVTITSPAPGQLSIVGPASLTSSNNLGQDFTGNSISYNFATSNGALATVDPATTLTINAPNTSGVIVPVTVGANPAGESVQQYATDIQNALTASNITGVSVSPGTNGVLTLTGPTSMTIGNTSNVVQDFTGTSTSYAFGTYTDPTTGQTTQAGVDPTTTLTITAKNTSGVSTPVTIAANPAGETVQQYATDIQTALAAQNITGATVTGANGALTLTGPSGMTIGGCVNQDIRGTTVASSVSPTSPTVIAATSPLAPAAPVAAMPATPAVTMTSDSTTVPGTTSDTYTFASTGTVNANTSLTITGPTAGGGPPVTTSITVTPTSPDETVTAFYNDVTAALTASNIKTGAGGVVVTNPSSNQLVVSGPTLTLNVGGVVKQDVALTTTNYNFVSSNNALATVDPTTNLAITEGATTVSAPASTSSQSVSSYAMALQGALTSAGITDITVSANNGQLSITGPADMAITGKVNQAFTGAQTNFDFGTYTDPNTGLTTQATVDPTTSVTITGPTTAGTTTTITVTPSNPAGESVAQYATDVQNALTAAKITGVNVTTANGALSIVGPDTVTIAGTMNQNMLGTTSNYTFESNATVDPTTNLSISGQTASGATATITAPAVAAGETVAQYASALTSALAAAKIANVAVTSTNGQLSITGANLSTTGAVKEGLADTAINYDFGPSATVNPATNITIVGPTVSGTPPTAITTAPTVTAGETVAQYATALMNELTKAGINTGPDGVSVTANGGQLSIIGPAATLKTAGSASQDLTATTISCAFGTSAGTVATVDPTTNLTISGLTTSGTTATTTAPTVTAGETLTSYATALTNSLTAAGITGVTVTATAAGQLSITGANISTSGSLIQDPVSSANASGTLAFDSNGDLLTPAANVNNITFAGLSDNSATMNMTWDLFGTAGAGNISQTAVASGQSAQNTNGYQSGVYQSFTIGSDGTVTATYSNGQTQDVGQLGIATVSNQQGLVDVGSTEYQTTSASGQASVGVAGTDGRGALEGSSLEASNVNISAEFSDLIIAQRAFEANSKAVTTFDTVTQETINMIH